MKMTATQKIIAKHANKDFVKPGDIVVAKVDIALANDITAPLAIKEVRNLGNKVAKETRVVLVMDHFAPNKDIKAAQQCKIARDFAIEHGIEDFYDVGDMGIEHALLPEKGIIVPGDLILGADSHTCTYGALGAFGTGVGSTDLGVAIATGKCWLRVPSAIKVNLTGSKKRMVSGKDIILHLIGILGVDGATYKSLEFFGEGLNSLTVEDKLTIANMGIECGAKNAYFALDDKTREYLKSVGVSKYDEIYPDEDAEYEQVININLDDLDYTISFPHLPSNTKTFMEIDKIKVDQVVIGSCTNGRMQDLEVAAKILKGKKVAKHTRVIIIPATQKIYLESIKAGYTEIFINAGAVVSTPTCGPCLGGYMGILAQDESAITTTNRNFVGRMGHVTSKIYLASPAVAAASAISGYITNPDTIEIEE